MTTRLAAIDSARGLAIFGILLINIQSFGQLDEFRYHRLAEPGLVSQVVWWFNMLLADGKFISLLSLLFGMGLVWLQKAGNSYQYRRLRYLALFGAVHGFLIWDGDILLMYALTAMVVLPFVMGRPRFQLLIAGVLIILATLVFVALVLLTTQGGEPDTTPLAIYNQGSYLSQCFYRLSSFGYTIASWPVFILPMVSGLMLAGAAIAQRPAWFMVLKRYWYGWLLLGLVPSWLLLWQLPDSGFGWLLMFSPFQALGYLGLMLRIGEHWRLLQRAGRLALSHYLLQSLVMTGFFYGFGLYGQFSRLTLLAIALGYIALALALTPLYLRYFSQGPMEWLWRRLAHRDATPG
ncbi:DUF418 domain-containing protein [Gallaecimonas pentaromativorans]|uniref:DUF418 domain-containing protein n=1 Tax=Gallaecimonas pentaromativorans TaxID=584787 RepID=A0A3N1NS59_9GAMM|nr:DUF418 domain-containing protein [Gallaecimonas pentaromativorans]ROQ22644.1 uncharacterized protein EDC28_109133 [Gallaecimonas pentaromativorans]